MGGLVALFVSAIIGALLAVFGVVGLVSSQSASPPVVESPYITYDS